ncbi:unannotated protein [freshwater metagenome]|uniref:Unannotated protein n=1 Tax=freshwater metagenome TaxID=449393 RepID=A0A6J7E1U4_9ZZZZ|nr:hypothetical protein [Actinomycetota bacterium]
MRRRGIATLLIIATVAMTAVSCGVPSSSKFSTIDRANIPFGLSDTTTSTTTTTTIVPASTTTLVEPATTIATEPVLLYYVAGTQLVSVTQLLPRPVSIAQTMAVLEAGPPREFGLGLRTAIPEGAQSQLSEAAGVVTVDLPIAFFKDMAPQDQRLAIAQIVLTLTDQRGVGQVTFTQNNLPISVLRGGGDLTQPGQLLVSADYEQLLSSSAGANTQPTTPTAPTTATTTGEP